ncbi:hypothetical protein HORIV_18380 [Vreelandella olivaria]|uniref:Carbohydrate kinase FGGY N-terminal domain-containing protein n=1 Tax=Vreelandella olivaria TaxID=390919 RepID=A0ABN5WTX7_9GAMM|nr:hypothetical protein HORIV_18380 [Halomonas olivaria]
MVSRIESGVFAALDKAAVSASQVRGMGVSGQQHGMVALDGNGVPVYPAKLWCDTETSAQNADLVARLGARRVVWRSWG